MSYTTDPARIERNWRAITIELDSPRPGRLERMLQRLGLPTDVSRLVVATPALRRSWFVALGLSMLIGLLATDAAKPRDDLFVLLLIAPLVPTLGVAMAYGSNADPAHEVGLATPMSGLRLVLTRAAAVLGFSAAFLALISLLAPSAPAMAFGWLIPSFGLCSATVAAMTFMAPRRAATVAGTLWVLGVLIARGAGDDPLAAFTVVGQVLMAVVAVVGLVVAVQRRDRFDLLAVR